MAVLVADPVPVACDPLRRGVAARCAGVDLHFAWHTQSHRRCGAERASAAAAAAVAGCVRRRMPLTEAQAAATVQGQRRSLFFFLFATLPLESPLLDMQAIFLDCASAKRF